MTALCELPNLLFFWMSHIQRICRNPPWAKTLCSGSCRVVVVLGPRRKGFWTPMGLVSPVGWAPGSTPPDVWKSPSCIGWLRNLALGFEVSFQSGGCPLILSYWTGGTLVNIMDSFNRSAVKLFQTCNMFESEAAGRGMRLLRHWMQLRITNCNFWFSSDVCYVLTPPMSTLSLAVWTKLPALHFWALHVFLCHIGNSCLFT